MTPPQSDRRAALSGVDDAKVRSTRRRLAAALRDAAEERGGRGVSVGDLVARAGISRSTFYTHFANVDELAAAAIADVFADLAPLDVDRRTQHDLTRADITRRGLRELLDALLGSRHLLALAADGAAAASIRERFVDAMASTLDGTIRVERPDMPPAVVEATAQYIAAGVLRLLLRAIAAGSDGEADREQLLAVLFELLPDYLTG